MAQARMAVILAAVVVVLAGGPAMAAEESQEKEKDWAESGIYLGGNLGLFALQDTELRGLTGFPAPNPEVSFDIGGHLGGVLGYRLGNGLRFDAELALRSNELDEVEVSGFGSTGVDGQLYSVALMANAYYDIAVKNRFFPYVGGGAGFARIAIDSDDLGADESDSQFAYQFRVGLGVKLTPSFVITAGYGYFATNEVDFDGVKADYRSHNVEAGLRVGF